MPASTQNQETVLLDQFFQQRPGGQLLVAPLGQPLAQPLSVLLARIGGFDDGAGGQVTTLAGLAAALAALAAQVSFSDGVALAFSDGTVMTFSS